MRNYVSHNSMHDIMSIHKDVFVQQLIASYVVKIRHVITYYILLMYLVVRTSLRYRKIYLMCFNADY